MLLLYHAARPQNNISGKIVDQDNSPLPGVTIFLPEINKGTISDKDGQYALVNLPNGNSKIHFSCMGYSDVVKTIQFSGSEVVVDVKLQSCAIESEEIVITGGFNTAQHENAVKIEKLSIEPFEVKATPNFTEMLTKIPGVDMISKGSGISKPVIRGLSMNDILVLNNGVRYENYQYSSHHPLGIDEFGIDEVEIIKGPASLLYGSDAIGGVINFLKEKPAPVGTVISDYTLQLFSNTLGMTNNLGIKGTSNKMFAGIRVGQKTNSDFLQGGGKFAPNSRFNEFSLKSNIGFTARYGTFKIYYDYSEQKLGLVEEDAFVEIRKRARKPEIYYQQLNTHLLSNQNKFYIGKLKLDVNIAFQHTEITHFSTPKNYEIQMNLATITYETKLYLPIGEKSEYIFGFQGMDQMNTNLNDRKTKLLPDATIHNYSLFGVFQQKLSEKLTVQTGIRYDNKSLSTIALGIADADNFRQALDKTYGSFSGSAGATYKISERLLIRTNVAAAYRTPNLAELISNGQHETRYELGNQSLVPEKSMELDISTHYHIANLTLDLAGFYNQINHYIFISPTGDTMSSGVYIFKYAQRDAYLFGGETGIHFHPENLRWIHLAGTIASVVGKQQNGVYLPFVPANKLTFEISLLTEKLATLHAAFVTFNYHYAFKQANVAPDETPTKGYALFDLAVGGNLKVKTQTVSIGLGVTNIFDTKYIDHLSTLKEVNLLNPGRNLTLNLKIPFGLRHNN